MNRVLLSIFVLFVPLFTIAAERSALIVADKPDEMPELKKLVGDGGWNVAQVAQKELDVNTLATADAVVVYIHEVIVGPVEKALIDYAEQGGRLIIIHHALASAKMQNPRWLEFLGVKIFPRNDKTAPWFVSADIPFTVVNIAPKHYITTNKVDYTKTVHYRSAKRKGIDGEFPAFVLNDSEIFHNQLSTDGDAKTPLFAYLLDDPKAKDLPETVPASDETAGWLKKTGKGWTVYLQPGHAPTDFQYPAFQRIMLNALDWPGDVLVFDFESGDLDNEGWRIVEGENSKPIGNRDTEFHHEKVPYAKSGRYYLTTLESAANTQPTDDTVCVMESPVFILSGSEATLRVGGGNRPNTYVALCPLLDNGTVGEPVRKAQGMNSQGLENIVWNVAELIGKPTILQVVDNETGAWAHIRMDDFRADGKIDPDKTALRKKHLDVLAEQKKEREKERQAAIKSNSFLVAQPILYVTRKQYKPDHHNTETLFQTGEINTGSFEGGGSLRLWNPKDDSVRVLLELPEGIVRDPCLSFDAKRLLVSIRRNIKDDYHIYEIILDEHGKGLLRADKPFIFRDDTKLDGTPLRQLTSLPAVSDIDPLYLPSGEIVFSATREPKFCMCNRHIMCNLYKMNGDGSNIQQIGKSTLFEGHASLLPDGRILYDRWEYVDRNFGDAQGVWITTPAGFNHAIFWGNNTSSPGGVIDARVLPGSDSIFVSTFSSCHDRPWGAIALVDRRLGIDGKQSVLQTWPADAVNLVDAGGYDTFARLKQKFEDPFPLSPEWFLASGTVGSGERTGLWLLGRDGTMELVHTDADAPGCYDPTPLIPTTPPPVIAQEVDFNDPNGYLYVSNVYKGFGMDVVEPDSVKFLRVVESPEKRTWSSRGWDNGTGTQAPGMTWKDFNNKRILGTVPVSEDGSVSIAVPADTFLYLQLLDEEGRMIQTMRSGMIVRPGETNGCFGCHEDRLTAAPPVERTPTALTKSPQPMNGWHGTPRLFSYMKEVQEPVFDKYCVECHDYGKVESNPKKPNLAGDLNAVFNTSYVELLSKNLVNAVGAGPSTKLKPYSWGSTKSRLVEILEIGHPRPEIDAKRKELGIYIDRKTNPEAFDRVVTWIDINTPYYPTYATSFPNNPYGRCPLTEKDMKRLAELTGRKNDHAFAFAISFTRPERSRCLDRWKTDADKQTPEYKEALELIKTGGRFLALLPRGDGDPALVTSSERDAKQMDKYVRMQEIEALFRDAIRSDKKVFDRNIDDPSMKVPAIQDIP